jgi:hypothetical protein
VSGGREESRIRCLGGLKRPDGRCGCPEPFGFAQGKLREGCRRGRSSFPLGYARGFGRLRSVSARSALAETALRSVATNGLRTARAASRGNHARE